MKEKLQRIDSVRWRLPKSGKMNVPVRLYANDAILKTVDDAVLQQAQNVAAMPGIVGEMLLMADCHLG
ncbi:MAG: RNA-splicing ligase RtcB, partial [Candidatus Diapherotrites archaeon]|nr:RNA-splicing ligase RtcB [Candidatus Diapherotrites archaeon]